MSESKMPRTDDESTLAAMVRELDAKLTDALAAKERAEEAERSLSEQVKAMDAALADAERDAERYRWLRDNKIYYTSDSHDGMTWAGMDWCVDVASMSPPTLDAAIDAAIAVDAARGVKS